MATARLRDGSNGRSAERFRFVEPFAHCSELGSIGHGGLVAEHRMGSGGIVVSHPVGNDTPGVVETESCVSFNSSSHIFELKASQIPCLASACRG